MPVDINAKDDAGMSVSAPLFEVRTGRFPGPQKNVLTRLSMARDARISRPFSTITMAIALRLWGNDFKGRKIVMAGCQEGVDKFYEY